MDDDFNNENIIDDINDDPLAGLLLEIARLLAEPFDFSILQ